MWYFFRLPQGFGPVTWGLGHGFKSSGEAKEILGGGDRYFYERQIGSTKMLVSPITTLYKSNTETRAVFKKYSMSKMNCIYMQNINATLNSMQYWQIGAIQHLANYNVQRQKYNAI